MNLHIELDSNHIAYEWLEKQADKLGAKGHIGTHIDCYTSTPPTSEYHLSTLVIDCRKHMPTLRDISAIPTLKNKALILYTGNLYENSYGTQEYFNVNTSISKEILTSVLEKEPSLILIDSHGIGQQGENHISLDKQCELSNCYVIENICITPENNDKIQFINVEFDLDYPSTGKPCRVTF